MSIEPVIVTLAGDFDASNADELERLLDPARESRKVVIDFSSVRYVDSSCLTHLAMLRRSRLDRGLPVCRLVVPSKAIRRIFQIVGFDRAFPLFDSIPDALASIA